MDIYIEEISYEPLNCLEGKSHDPDAVNLLAKKLCSLTRDEVNKFEVVRELNGITDLKKGVIPMFIAAALNPIKQYIVICKNGAEMELSATLLTAINEKP